jgi:hypothetical protein
MGPSAPPSPGAPPLLLEQPIATTPASPTQAKRRKIPDARLDGIVIQEGY